MKKKVILLIIIFLFPIIVKASSVTLSCDSDIVRNNTLTCTVKGNASTLVIGLSMKVKTGNNITFKSFTPNSKWQGDGEEGKIDLYTSEDIKGNFNIGTIIFNINQVLNGLDSSISLNQISFYDEKGSAEELNNYTKNIRIASSNNNLSSLSINVGSLNPAFNSSITTYSTTINTSSITISAKTENNNAKITGDIGTKNLSYGNNTFKINVTSESGTVKIYTINIVRPDNGNNTNPTSNKSNNNYLKEITSDDIKIDFNKNTLEYNTSVSYDKEKINITATAEDNKAKVEILNPDALQVGDNKIEIKVTSENNNTRTYIINVTRKEENDTLSSNTNISDLTIKNYDINFDKNILVYDLKIKYEKSLDIKLLLEDNTSTYKIEGNNNLKNNSKIKIIVTSLDNTTKTYTINIKTNDKIIKIIFISIYSLLIIINILRIIFKKRNVTSQTKNLT